MVSRLAWSGVQSRTRRARSLDATRRAGSPALVAAIPPPAATLKFAPRPAAPTKPVAPAAAPTAQATDATWKRARTTTTGKTNVRGAPTLQSPVVKELYPGSVVMVQKAENDWWKARPSSGAAFDGYIREDRLVFK